MARLISLPGLMGYNASLVLHLVLPGGQRLLLDGDIEAKAESCLVPEQGVEGLASDVMLLPHHGSSTSSTDSFVASVHPTLAIAQTGYANRYGFPAPAVKRRRYTKLGAHLRNTAEGAVIVDFPPSGPPKVIKLPPVSSAKRNRALQWWRHFL